MAWLFRDFCTFIQRYEPLRHRHHWIRFWIRFWSSFWIVEHHRSSFWIVEHHWSSVWIVVGISLVKSWSSSDVTVPVFWVDALFFFAFLSFICCRWICWSFSGLWSCWFFGCRRSALLLSFALIVVNSSFLSFDYTLLLLPVWCNILSLGFFILFASPIIFSSSPIGISPCGSLPIGSSA